MQLEARLHPARALRHPLWWAALALLVVNDHVLKHAAVLPGVLTGKLSDLAGMLVAPALLAVLLGLRTRRALLGAHLAVAAVFTALQLSPAFAALWALPFDTLGVGWRTWSDPTDLLALPMLALSWHVLVRGAMAPSAAARDAARARASAWHRAAAPAAATLGAVFCVATSPVPPAHQMVPGRPDLIEADAWLYNATLADLDVRVRLLGDSASIDCERLRADPAGVLRPDHFTRDLAWVQPPDQSAALWPFNARTQLARARGCYAVMLEVADSDPVFVVWDEQSLPVRGVALEPGGLDALVPGAVTVELAGEAVALCGKGNVTVLPVREP